MDGSPRLRTVREGGLEILVPEEPTGGLSSAMLAFYNPRMATCRDISLLCGEAFARSTSGVVACDLLSATGVRGLRYLRITRLSEILMNDIGKTAFELMRRNLKLNFETSSESTGSGSFSCMVGNKQIRISSLEARLLLAQHKHEFHLLDLDPFGSPADLAEPSLKSLRHGSLLCVTATDTATLCGTYPGTCVRRYGALPLKTEYKHEVGLRTLVAYFTRRAASMEASAVPVFCHATDHYYRVYLRVLGSRSKADQALTNVGWGSHCEVCGERKCTMGFLPPSDSSCCGRRMRTFGPLWVGPMKDGQFVEDVRASNRPEFAIGPKAYRVIDQVGDEMDVFSYHDVHAISRRLRVHAPRTSCVIDGLGEIGFPSSGTHHSGTGVKTSAPATEVRRMIRGLAPG